MSDALKKVSEVMRTVITWIDHQKDMIRKDRSWEAVVNGRAPHSYYVNAALRYYEKWEKT